METVTGIPMQSASIAELTKALSAFQGSLQQPKLNKTVAVQTKTGGKYTFQYADLGACISAAAPLLSKNGLAVIQTIQGNVLVTTLSHSSGEFMNSQLPLNEHTLYSTDFQSIGSMITYLKRYAYCAILGIVADEDDDANSAVGNQYQYQTKGKATAQQQKEKPQQASGVTGAQLKAFIDEVNAKQTIEELVPYWQQVYQEHPEMQTNTTFNNALFQKASALGIAELENCHNEDDILLLIDRWNGIWKAVIADNTPFGNAIIAKRQSFAQ